MKHRASLATEEKDQVMDEYNPAKVRDVLILLGTLCPHNQEETQFFSAGGRNTDSFRAFLPNKTGTDFSFPSSTDSNDQHPECRSKVSITSSRSSLVHIASFRLAKISKDTLL